MEKEGGMDHGESPRETFSFVVVDLFLNWETCLGCWRSLSQKSESRKRAASRPGTGLPKRIPALPALASDATLSCARSAAPELESAK
jgi:hypothetical protein